MCENVSSEKFEPVEEPFADNYGDPVFTLDDSGEVVDYVEQPEFWAYQYLNWNLGIWND